MEDPRLVVGSPPSITSVRPIFVYHTSARLQAGAVRSSREGGGGREENQLRHMARTRGGYEQITKPLWIIETDPSSSTSCWSEGAEKGCE